jgi:hypothetical protein
MSATGRKLWRKAMDASRVVFLVLGIVFGGILLGATIATVSMKLFPPPHAYVTNATT